MFDITPLVLLVIAAGVTAIAYFGRKYVAPVLKDQMTIEERRNLYDAVVIGVAAAEQLCKTGVIKKDERIQHVFDFLEANNITYDRDVVNDMIESAVLDLPKSFLGLEDEEKKKE